MQKLCFSNFCVLSLTFEIIFFRFAKNTIKIVFFCIFVLLLLKEKKKAPQKKITGISGLGLFGPKMAVSWRTSVFQKTLLKPLFL